MNRSASFAGPDDLSHAWPEASLCNAEQPKEQEIAYLCGIRYLQQCSDTPDRTFVMSRGKRFESARRLSAYSRYLRPTKSGSSKRAWTVGAGAYTSELVYRTICRYAFGQVRE